MKWRVHHGPAHGHGAKPYGQTGWRRVAREIFPLPTFAVEELQDRSMSRSCQRRVLRRRHLQEESNQVIHGLNRLNNFCGGAGGDGNHPKGELSAVQLKTLEFVEKCMGELGSPGDVTGPGALMALRVSEGYEDLPSSSTLGSFDPALVSLPAGEVQPVDLAALWGEGGQTMVEEFIRSQLVSPNEALQRIQEEGPQEVYSDPKLRVRRSYIDFVKKLIDLGLVDLSTEKAVEEVGIFFVKKKLNKLRLILDCRRSNHWFKPPTAVSLATGESLRRVAVEEEEELFVCSADLANAFYTLSMPEELRGLFGLRRLRASELGIREVKGQSVQESEWIQPRLAVLPMGWSWALYWYQAIHERLAERSGLKEEERLKDFSPAPQGNFWHVQYVDNLHVFGTDRGEVVERFRRAVSVLKEAGLTVHEIEECENETKVLGWQYTHGHLFRPSRERIWKIKLAVRQLLRKGSSSGHQLERLVGHMTFASLGKREMLSILGETYTFIHKFQGQTVPIWKSVRKELQTWEALSPLIVQDLCSSWSTDLIAVDASEWGLGAVMREAKLEEVRALGRFNERWRFKNDVSSNARVFAYLEDEKSRLATEDGEENTNLVPCNPDFSAVPFDIINHDWQVVGRRRWQRQEGMPVLEARASLYGVKHLLRKSSNFGKRFVILTDSMTAACAVSKGRAQTWRLRSVVQKIAALLLATGSSLVSRWVPSEWNPSDGPSRGGFAASAPSRINLDGHPSQHTMHSAMASKGEAKDTKEGSSDCHNKEPKDAKRGGRQAAHMGHRDDSRVSKQKEEAEGYPTATQSARDSCGPQPTANRFSEKGHPGALHRALQDVGPSRRSRGTGPQKPSPAGPCVGELPEPRVSSRRRSGCGKLCGCRSGVFQSNYEREGEPSEINAVPERLEKALPTSKSNASSVRSGGPFGSHRSRRAEVRGGIDSPFDLLPVHETFGVHQDPGSRHCSPCQASPRELQELECPASSDRRGCPFEDRTVGRDVGTRPEIPTVHGSSARLSPEASGTKQDSKSILSDTFGGKPVHDGPLAKFGPSTCRSTSSIPAQTRGSITRSRQPSTVDAGRASTRKVAEPQVSQELREGGQTGPDFRPALRRSAKKVPRRSKGPRKKVPLPALSPSRSLLLPVFIEIFSGSGRLGKKIAALCGWPVLLWDISFGNEYDLTVPSNQQLLLGWARSGLLCGAHLGTPCNSFSRARDQPGGPPPLRSDHQPLGLPGLRPADALKVKLGNLMLRFSVRFLCVCLQMMIPCTLENPARSRLWICPPMVAFLRRRLVQSVQVEFCAFGTAWRKSTRFIGVHVDFTCLEPMRCIGSRRGCCRFTGLPHVPLTGQTSSGQWLTKLAEPYPWKLCRLLSRIFANVELSQIAKNFSRHAGIP